MKDAEQGVSEVIGAILLISVVAVAVAIIAVGLLSTPPPQEVPHANILAVRNNTTHQVILIHTGGDELDREELKIKLDNYPAESMFSPNFTMIPPGQWPWSPGESLQINNYVPTTIRIIDAGGNGEVLIDTIQVSAVAPGGGPDVPFIPPPSPCDGIEDLYLDCFLYEMMRDSIVFSRQRPGSQGETDLVGDLSFNITEDGSYLKLAGDSDPYYLNKDDRIIIRLLENSKPQVQLYMIGNRGWSLAITEVTGDNLKIYQNGERINNKNQELDESWITGSTTPVSTWSVISEGNGDPHTRLVINGTPFFDDPSNDEFELKDIYPSIPTLWIIKFPSGNSKDYILFVGRAKWVKQEGVQIYP